MPCFVAGHDYREIAEQNAVGVTKGQNSLGTDITFLLLLFAEKVAICRDRGHIKLFLSYLELQVFLPSSLCTLCHIFAIALIMFKFQGEAKQHLLSLMDDKSEVLGCNHTFPINNAMSIAPCTLYHIFMP